MGVASYTVIDGEIVSENRNGVQSDYIPDSLGSTVALVNSSHQITDTYTYWPYGEIRSHVGSSVTPYTYCGTIGYRSDSIGYYVRARELKAIQTRWLTTDSLWPLQFAFAAMKSSPTSNVDATGRQSQSSTHRSKQVRGKQKHGDPNKCHIYRCNRKDVLHHACVEVILQGGQSCSYGSWPNESVRPCGEIHSDPEWDCDLVAVYCKLASAICACMTLDSRFNHPSWLASGFCWGYSRDAICCGCASTPTPDPACDNWCPEIYTTRSKFLY